MTIAGKVNVEDEENVQKNSIEAVKPDAVSQVSWKDGLTKEYVSREVMLGLTIGFAQIPESVAFAYMAHIKPPIALHAAWMVGLCCSLFGGRPAMVNGATGAFAAIIGTFISDAGIGENGEGIETLFPSVMFAGGLVFIAGVTGMHRFIVMLPQSVIVGFCNGLAIVIGLAQLHPFKDAKTHHWKEGADFWCMLTICLASMITMEFLPKLGKYKYGRIFKVIPSSLLAIVVACFIEFAIIRPAALVTSEYDPLKPCLQKLNENTCVGTMTIKDASEFTAETAFPVPFFVPHGSINYDMSKTRNFDALSKIAIQGFLLCLVGSIESLLTSEVVESFTQTPSDGRKTLLATGVGNFISGFMGGMGGNAMIGLSTVNCLNGGTGRLAPTVTALLILVCCVGAYPMLNLIPVAALSGIMLVVVLHTFKWFTLRYLLQLLPSPIRTKFGIERSLPAYEIVVIITVTVLANWPAGTNIAYAVCAGTALSALGHAWSSSNAMEATVYMEGDTKVYDVGGPLSFAYANRLLKTFTPATDPDVVEIRLSYEQAMDYTAMHVLKSVQASYEACGKKLHIKSQAPVG